MSARGEKGGVGAGLIQRAVAKVAAGGEPVDEVAVRADAFALVQFQVEVLLVHYARPWAGWRSWGRTNWARL